ncbi:MAG: AAA family ATPase, partial [Myxococcota bacterium]|nr:AAA family ATPase [Myxococcota bacterium]
ASILREFRDPIVEQDDLIAALMQEKRAAYVTFHQSYTYEDLIEGLRPAVQDGVIQYNIEDGIFKQLALDAWRSYLWQEQTEEGVIPKTRDDARTAPQYFLVIDELNRGNVSKIFGELITLLEPSKRLGMEEQMIVTLPLSKEPFGVPANLHVIATMNTADRSIATLDIALRRRFRFEERMPDASVLENTLAASKVKEKVIALFNVLNQRIEFLIDRDHMLGHAIFMGVVSYSDLREVMRYNVIPLLQEYFYGEWDKIALVLGHDPGAAFGILKQHRLDRDALFPTAKDAVLEAARVRYEIDYAFLTAREEELAPYFDQVLGTGVGSP